MLSLRLYFSEFVLLSPRDDFSLSLSLIIIIMLCVKSLPVFWLMSHVALSVAVVVLLCLSLCCLFVFTCELFPSLYDEYIMVELSHFLSLLLPY